MTPTILIAACAFALLIVMIGVLIVLVVIFAWREIVYSWRCWRGRSDDDQWHA